MSRFAFLFILIILRSQLLVSAQCASGDLSDYTIQIGSVSLTNTVLRTSPGGNLSLAVEASPRPELSFRIRQLGTGISQTRVPYSLRYRNKSTNITYTQDSSGSFVGTGTTPNSTILIERALLPLQGMPFGEYELSVLLDRHQQVCDRNRNNNSTVVTSFLNYVPTADVEAGVPTVVGSTSSFDAGQSVPISLSVFNSDETLSPNPAVRVNFYLTRFEHFGVSGQRETTYSEVFSDPALRYLGWGTFELDAPATVVNLPLPDDLTEFEYSIAAVPNPDLVVPERGPSRNDVTVSYTKFTVRYVFERPELDADQDVVISPTTAIAGQSIRFQSAVKNSTPFPTLSSPSVHHYLQSEEFTTLRYLLGTTSLSPIPGASAGTTRSRSYDETFTIPPEVRTGRYRYLRIVDEFNLIPERRFETNTVSAGPIITVVAPTHPGLGPRPRPIRAPS